MTRTRTLRQLGLRTVLSWACVLSMLGCSAVQGGEQPRHLEASMVELIAFPNRFDGSVVGVFGYLEPLASYLYMTEDHARIGDAASGVHIAAGAKRDLMLSPCAGSYVLLIGYFARIDGLFGFTRVDTVAVFLPDRGLTNCWESADGDPGAPTE